MRKANKGQRVGNRSGRSGRGTDQKLFDDYQLARAICAKDPSGKNRRKVDSLQKRLTRRLQRASLRAWKARVKRAARKIKFKPVAYKSRSGAQVGVDEPGR
jgi:hypothetical protein